MINYTPKIFHHDERQYQHHDERQYQDNREYKQVDVSDLKNVNSTQVKEKQINPLGKRYKTVQIFLVKGLLPFIIVSHYFSFLLSLPEFFYMCRYPFKCFAFLFSNSGTRPMHLCLNIKSYFRT